MLLVQQTAWKWSSRRNSVFCWHITVLTVSNPNFPVNTRECFRLSDLGFPLYIAYWKCYTLVAVALNKTHTIGQLLFTLTNTITRIYNAFRRFHFNYLNYEYLQLGSVTNIRRSYFGPLVPTATSWNIKVAVPTLRYTKYAVQTGIYKHTEY
jgi:hypothetical protein